MFVVSDGGIYKYVYALQCEDYYDLYLLPPDEYVRIFVHTNALLENKDTSNLVAYVSDHVDKRISDGDTDGLPYLGKSTSFDGPLQSAAMQAVMNYSYGLNLHKIKSNDVVGLLADDE